MYQVWLKSLNLYSFSPENENMGVSRADNSFKIWRNLPISNPKPEIRNINAHTKFGENPLMFTWYPETKYGRTTDGRTHLQHETIISSRYRVAGY